MYDLYICLHRYINDEQFDSIVEAYNNILFKRSNKIKSVKVIFQKYYDNGILKNARQIFYHFYSSNETEPFLTYYGSYIMNKDDVEKIKYDVGRTGKGIR